MSEHDSEFFYFAHPGDTLSGVVNAAFGLTGQDLENKVKEVARRSHIKDPSRIRIGQPIALGKRDPFMSWAPILPHEMMALEQAWAQTPLPQRKTVEQHWDVWNLVQQHADKPATFVEEGFGAWGKVSEAQVRALKPPPLQAQMRLRTVVDRTERWVVQVRRNSIQVKRHARLSARLEGVVYLARDPRAVAGYATQLRSYSRIISGARAVGVTGNIFALAMAGKSVRDAWDTTDRHRTIATETGGILFGAGGAAFASYLACVAVLKLPTAGTSMFWCGLLMSSAGGLGLGWGGQKVGGYVYDQLVEKQYPVEPLK